MFTLSDTRIFINVYETKIIGHFFSIWVSLVPANRTKYYLFMNVAFTRLIKLQGLNREFNFRKLNGDPVHYHVDVTDERGQRILFQMEKQDNGAWRANAGQVPKWMEGAEPVIGDAIEEFMSGENK